MVYLPGLFSFQSPPAVYLRRCPSVCWIFLLGAFIIVFFLTFAAMFVHQTVNMYNEVDVKSINESDSKCYTVLRYILANKAQCHSCINKHTNFDELTNIVREHGISRIREEQLSRLRNILNGFEFFIFLVVFAVYGGSKIINIFTGISIICTFLAQHVTSFDKMIPLECVIVFVATIAFFQSLYSLVVTIIEIHTRRNIKDK